MRQPGDQQADRDIFNIDNKGTVTVINQPVPQRSRSESLLLQAVKQEVISRLAQSLHNAVFLNLGMQSQPQQVKRPWDAEIKIGSKSPEPLPAETTILDVFDRSGIDGRLLILGEPGAGKTTTILDLAKELCDRAEQKPTAFIPVLLNLSSWKDPKQTMIAWLVEELKSKYGVRKDIGTQWLAEKQLLPLLDGLDEVKPEHQESCVQAINRWLESEDRPPSLAVCCRREEYEKVVRGQWQAAAEEAPDETRMHLNGAILLQTLTDGQIETYLTAANQPELWQMLRQDEALWELIKTPLWLSITLLSYEGLSLKQWQQTASTEQRLSLLLDAYVARMLSREMKSQRYGKRKSPTAKHTRYWLIWLARQLTLESQTEFLIEKMQPRWLPNEAMRRTYRRRIGLILMPGIILIYMVLHSTPWSAVAFNLISEKIDGEIKTVDLLGWSWSKATNEFIQSLKLGSICGLIFGLITTLVLGFACMGNTNPIEGLLFGIGYGLLVFLYFLYNGLLIGCYSGLLRGLITKELKYKVLPNEGIWRSALNAIIRLVSMSFLTILIRIWADLLELPSVLALLVLALVGFCGGLAFGLRDGGKACIQHFVLRLTLCQNELIPWNYARFLDYCTERLFLQRVGGRYRFIHKSLQEHFARMGE